MKNKLPAQKPKTVEISASLIAAPGELFVSTTFERRLSEAAKIPQKAAKIIFERMVKTGQVVSVKKLSTSEVWAYRLADGVKTISFDAIQSKT